jgi:GNAT superfamily N-acetyltransferase
MYKITLLENHTLDAFDCGDEKKNEWLQKYALQNTKGGLGRTYVAVKPPDEQTIYGYYTISSSTVKFDNPPKAHLPRYPLPAILIGKLATAKESQGQGLGTALLFDALKRAVRVAEEIGVYAVEIQAVNEKAKTIHQDRGFTAMADEPMKLFMNLKKVRKLVLEGY